MKKEKEIRPLDLLPSYVRVPKIVMEINPTVKELNTMLTQVNYEPVVLAIRDIFKGSSVLKSAREHGISRQRVWYWLDEMQKMQKKQRELKTKKRKK